MKSTSGKRSKKFKMSPPRVHIQNEKVQKNPEQKIH